MGVVFCRPLAGRLDRLGEEGQFLHGCPLFIGSYAFRPDDRRVGGRISSLPESVIEEEGKILLPHT